MFIRIRIYIYIYIYVCNFLDSINASTITQVLIHKYDNNNNNNIYILIF